MASGSSSGSTGNRAIDAAGSAWPWSVAMPTMCGSCGCSGGLPNSARYISSFGSGYALYPSTSARSQTAQPRQRVRQAEFGRAAQLVHQRPPRPRRDEHLAASGPPVAVAVLAGLVDVEAVMRVLDQRNLDPARDQPGDHPLDQRRLARPRPSGEAEDACRSAAHRPRPSVASATVSAPSARLTLTHRRTRPRAAAPAGQSPSRPRTCRPCAARLRCPSPFPRHPPIPTTAYRAMSRVRSSVSSPTSRRPAPTRWRIPSRPPRALRAPRRRRRRCCPDRLRCLRARSVC